MLWIPKKGVLRVEHNLGTVGSGTPGTSVTTGGAASTKGSYAVLIASTAFDSWWTTIVALSYGASAVDSQLAIDVGIGSATEEIIIANLLGGGAPSGSLGANREWQFPLYIPAGSRITARGAGDRVSTAFTVAIILRGGDGSPPFRLAGKVTTYGMGTVPAGTTIVPGAAGAEGAWAQIIASTTEDHFAFLPSFQSGLDTTKSSFRYWVDMGIGAATEEEIVGGQSIIFGTTDTEGGYGPWPSFPAFQDVPAGTRLTMRASTIGTPLDSGNYNGVIHAMS